MAHRMPMRLGKFVTVLNGLFLDSQISNNGHERPYTILQRLQTCLTDRMREYCITAVQICSTVPVVVLCVHCGAMAADTALTALACC